MDWSREQDAALKSVARWLSAGTPQVYRLFGYAGTGKTTLARHLAEGIDGFTAFGAFTGKAAHVMRLKGCAGASTIHSMIYRPRGEEEDGPTFGINRDGPAARAELIVIDECSMVDEEVGRDLLSFGKPVLVLGDPAQLPPVAGGGFFTEGEPEMMLTEVHRQAADSPIIRLSMDVREGKTLTRGTYGKSRVIGRREIDAEAILAADQVLVGTNRTRRAYNQRIRELKGFESTEPEVGDKLVCLRNDKAKGFLNGSTWFVESARKARAGRLRYGLTPDDEGAAPRAVVASIHPAFFGEGPESLPYPTRRKSDEFDFGYALTVHKAQGSQWSDVVLFDESFAFREHRSRWLYTGITRAAESLTVVE